MICSCQGPYWGEVSKYIKFVIWHSQYIVKVLQIGTLKLTCETHSQVSFWCLLWFNMWYINGLVQERQNSIANVLELHLSYTNPSICSTMVACSMQYPVITILQYCGNHHFGIINTPGCFYLESYPNINHNHATKICRQFSRFCTYFLVCKSSHICNL